MSRHHQLNELLDVILAVDPSSVLDTGTGPEVFGVLVREYLDRSCGRVRKQDWRCRIDRLEGSGSLPSPQNDVYDEIVMGNIHEAIPRLTTRYDLVLLIDVLEHYDRVEGARLLSSLERHAANILISTSKVSASTENGSGGTSVRRFLWTENDLQQFGDVFFVRGEKSLICLIGSRAGHLRRSLTPWRRFVRRALRLIGADAWRKRSSPVVTVTHEPNSPGSVLAVCPPDWTGVLQSIAGDASAHAAPKDAARAIQNDRPAIVRFGGYDITWRPVSEEARARGCRVEVTVQGTPLFHEIDASARHALAAAIEDYRRGLIHTLVSSDPGVAETLTALGVPCSFRPNQVKWPDRIPTGRAPGPGLQIGIFGNGAPWKNLECQILAAAIALRQRSSGAIHVQCAAGQPLVKTLGIRYEVHPWTERPVFLSLLGTMSVNLAVSVTETFGYLSVESFLMGVPCLFSPMTSAFQEIQTSHPLWRCRVERIDDPSAIARALDAVLADRVLIAEAGMDFCRRYVGSDFLPGWTRYRDSLSVTREVTRRS